MQAQINKDSSTMPSSDTRIEKVHNLLTSFAAQDIRVVVAGNNEQMWKGMGQHQKYEIEHILQKLMITIISLLSQGMLQKDIPAYLLEHQIKPSGLSSVEKHLNRMKEVLEFNKNEQLVAFCKDMGII